MILQVKMSLSEVLSVVYRSRRPAGAPIEPATRSVPLMTKVPLVGHPWEVAHENRLALDLAGLIVHELCGDEERRGVGDVALLHSSPCSSAARTGGP